MTKITISNAAHIAAAMLCQSSEETRYWLNGIHIVAAPQGGVLIVSTDGHRMSIAHDPDGSIECADRDKGVIVNFDAIAKKHLKPAYRVEFDNGTAKAIANQSGRGFHADEQVAVAIAREIDGTFPDWRRVLPTEPIIKRDDMGQPVPPKTEASFNPNYIGDFGKIAKAYGASTAQVTLVNPCPNSPHWVILDGLDVSWRGVLMPMTSLVDRGDMSAPDWLSSPEPMAAAAE